MSKSKAGQVLIRFWIMAFIFALFPYGLLGILSSSISLSFLVLVSLGVTLFFNFIQWITHWLLFSGTKEYQDLRSKGLDLWFDVSCPWPFRPDGLATEEEPTSRFYCNNCGTEAFDLEAPCRICGFEQYECPRCGTVVRDRFARCPRCG